MSKLIKFSNHYDRSGLEFPVSTKDIGLFEINNDVSINVLAVERRDIYIHRKSRRTGHRTDLLLVSENGINNYTVIKLLRWSETKKLKISIPSNIFFLYLIIIKPCILKQLENIHQNLKLIFS